MSLSRDELKAVLIDNKNIAIVGVSKSSERDSNIVAKYMIQNGYKIIPINPTANKILGLGSYKNLLEIPEHIHRKLDMVNIFRPSQDVPSIVDQAIDLKRMYGKPHVIWMQLNISHSEAAEKGRREGFTVIMDKCLKIEHERMNK